MGLIERFLRKQQSRHDTLDFFFHFPCLLFFFPFFCSFVIFELEEDEPWGICFFLQRGGRDVYDFVSSYYHDRN